MAIIHPRLSPTPAKQGGFHRELALLEMLRVGLPEGHGLVLDFAHVPASCWLRLC